MKRKPIVAGTFYPDNPEQLEQEIKEAFLSKFGPGSLPSSTRTKHILGAIVPHAGYIYSGPCAAWVYKEIAESKIPDVYIMLGLSHSGYPTSVSIEDWETPLGTVTAHLPFGKYLCKKGLPQNEKPHQQEHSIEVQLPFLQFVNKDKMKILPIITSPDMDYKRIAAILSESISESKLRVTIIASSDFTHFGINYGFYPFRSEIKENLYKLDRKAIEYIERLDASGFLDYVSSTGATICGQYPIAVLLETAKRLGAKKARLLTYYTSGDIVNNYSSAVGYAGIIIE